MADKKIIAVTGATGAQAGGLARAILDDPSGEFALRAVTRNPGKEKHGRSPTATPRSCRQISTTRPAYGARSTGPTARTA
jgi:NmrA-like family protein